MKLAAPVLPGIAVCVGLVLAGCSNVPTQAESKFTEVGPDTYRIVREAVTGFTRNAEKLEAEARAEAEKYCTERGRKLRVISATQHRPFYTTGYASVEITFQALAPDDPALKGPAPTAIVTTVATTAGSPTPAGDTATASVTPTDDLYDELLKLDDLRKRGILTEKEFQAEKKKLLQRSR